MSPTIVIAAINAIIELVGFAQKAIADSKQSGELTTEQNAALDKKIADLERESVRWRKRAERAEALVDIQKKVAALLGTPLESEKS